MQIRRCQADQFSNEENQAELESSAKMIPTSRDQVEKPTDEKKIPGRQHQAE